MKTIRLATHEEPPKAIIVTIGAKMYGENGYRWWLRNFLNAMARSAEGDDVVYWLRAGAQPKVESLQYVYLVIGGRIRFRCFYGGSRGEGHFEFDEGRRMYGRSWLILAGPVERAPRGMAMKGFQGFRYSHKLF